MKRGRKPKYKTKAERIQAKKETRKKWEERNSKKLKKYQSEWHKAHYIPKHQRPESIAYTRLNERVTELETEQKEILLTLEEVLKDNKRLENLIKWGEKKDEKI